MSIDRTRCSYLLTGATGLVGRYLLAGLLRRGFDVAVLVRDANMGSAAARINACLAVFEQQNLLPRPKVMTADLADEQVISNPGDLDWFQDRPVKVIHCAASIRFVEGRDGEPYKTNVEGTRNLLRLCERINLQEFHYVSTAYVGCRSQADTIQEVPVLNTARAGNDYERSKIEAERLISTASWIPASIIHRPSIVVGDSRTGYTSTYHGFYAPLQIGAQFANEYGFSEHVGDWFRQQLGVNASDQKNLVPVDWVAESIVEMATTRLPSATILHWTNPCPVSCDEMQRAITDSIEVYSQKSRRTPSMDSELPSLKMFQAQLSVYESYFGNDPVFDTTSATRYCPHVPCPSVDYSSLRKTAEYALGEKFGWPRPRLAELPYGRLRDVLTRKGRTPTPRGALRLLELQTLGPGGVETLVFAEQGDGWSVCSVPSESSHLRLIISMERLSDCIFGSTAIDGLIACGRAAIVGSSAHDWLDMVADWQNDVKSYPQPD